MSSNGTGDTDGQFIPYIPTVSNIWRVADLLEREVYDFYGIVFLGHPDMRRLFLRSDFKGYPFRKDKGCGEADDYRRFEDKQGQSGSGADVGHQRENDLEQN